jgi:hypothetical protein
MVYYLGILLLSAAFLLLELTLIRLFAVQQFYHFAFMAISLALLGAGASGSLLSIWQRRFNPAALSLAFAVTAVFAYLLINCVPFDSFSIAWDRRQIFYLAVYFLAAAGPFLFGGLLVGGELIAAGELMAAGAKEGGGSHLVYGANLMGSGLGCVLTLPALSAFGGEGALIFAAMVAALAGLSFWLSEDFLPPRRKRRKDARNLGVLRVLAVKSSAVLGLSLVGFLLAGLVVLVWPPAALSQQLSPYKTLPTLSQAIDAQHTLTAWDATARVDVVESSSIHVMPGLSLLSPVGPPPQAALMLDGDGLMPIVGLPPESEQALQLAQYTPGGLVYQLRPDSHALILEAGTGMDVWLALAAGAERVTAVEDNRLILDIMRHDYREFTHGLYLDPRVELVNEAGRVYARSAVPGSYGLVQVALTDPHRPVTSGAYSLTEDYTYTVEAFGDYLHALEADGILAITRWLQTPPSESGRTFGAMAAALQRSGHDPAQHLVAFRTMRTMTILAAKRPFTPDEIDAVRTFLRERNFDAVYFPGIQTEELNRYNVLPEPAYHNLFVAILDNPAQTYADYRFDIRPPTDNRPFFFHYFRWQQTPEILATLGMTWQPFGGSGYFVLVALLILVGLAAAVFILGPLLIWHFWRGPLLPMTDNRSPKTIPFWRLRVFVYFAGLGLGFLFVEIPLAQRFILVLGQPVTALAVILFAVLLFSGLGSLTVRRWSLPWALALLVGAVALYPLLLGPFSDWALTLPGWGRMLASALVIAPLGYLMGLPFASGLRVLERDDPALVPWAWAINGSFSVISAVLAVMVALSWGFTAVLWLGAAAYLAALLALGKLGVKRET